MVALAALTRLALFQHAEFTLDDIAATPLTALRPTTRAKGMHNGGTNGYESETEKRPEAHHEGDKDTHDAHYQAEYALKHQESDRPLTGSHVKYSLT